MKPKPIQIQSPNLVRRWHIVFAPGRFAQFIEHFHPCLSSCNRDRSDYAISNFLLHRVRVCSDPHGVPRFHLYFGIRKALATVRHQCNISSFSMLFQFYMTEYFIFVFVDIPLDCTHINLKSFRYLFQSESVNQSQVKNLAVSFRVDPVVDDLPHFGITVPGVIPHSQPPPVEQSVSQCSQCIACF